MFNFPDSPIEDQEFTPPGGVTYVYKAPRWIAKPHGDIFVHKAGDVMTGPLRVADHLYVGVPDCGIKALEAEP